MTKAIILAAGQGTRLRPYTNNLPKAMVPLDGEPLLHRQKKVLNEVGIHSINVVTGYLEEYISESNFKKYHNPVFDETNMVASLYHAKELFDGTCDIIISYGDIIYEKKVIEKLLRSEGNINVIIDKKWEDLWGKRMENPLSDAETLKLTEDGYISELGKKPETKDDIEGQYIGLIKISQKFAPKFFNLYDSVDKNKKYDGQDFHNMYMTTYLQLLINNSIDIKAVPICNGWLEVDTVQDLKKYEQMIVSGTIDKLCKV